MYSEPKLSTGNAKYPPIYGFKSSKTYTEIGLSDLTRIALKEISVLVSRSVCSIRISLEPGSSCIVLEKPMNGASIDTRLVTSAEICSVVDPVCYAETKFCDAPSTVSEDEMRDHLHVTAVPRNLWESGYFEEDLEASDAATCIISCCDRPLCNVAWYTIRKCFTIECVSERACEPVSQEAEIYKETLFIQIRSVNVTFHTSPVECEYGVTICGSHRHCVLKLGSKSRQGTCQCENGYIENTEGMCVLESIDKGDKTDDFKIRNPGDVSNSINGHSENVPVTSVYVEQLTVSVGENKILQLPNKEVSLVAFTLPEESKEGLYTFRVQVTGTNKFGDALVNVTVIPPARKNVPPVAKVRPTDLVVKLPNSAILDGSDSTDDDKIVSYLWEVVKGPLQDKSITGDKAILSLTDLLPGNYTFKNGLPSKGECWF
ncbi:K319L-like protein [Mya arenaria]|uniref:K319L-like protein n=1 Tax=Mya arenaria TaxID=6604 RepID=A0ABY7F6C0_MYAAR|nr:K319L-like protein [Mya arenaria]